MIIISLFTGLAGALLALFFRDGYRPGRVRCQGESGSLNLANAAPILEFARIHLVEMKRKARIVFLPRAFKFLDKFEYV